MRRKAWRPLILGTYNFLRKPLRVVEREKFVSLDESEEKREEEVRDKVFWKKWYGY